MKNWKTFSAGLSFKIFNRLLHFITHITIFGSGALSGKMLLVRIVENNRVDAYYRAC